MGWGYVLVQIQTEQAGLLSVPLIIVIFIALTGLNVYDRLA